MTEKQLRWQKRNRILWRLKGMTGFSFEEGVLTPLENDRLNTAFGIIRGVIQDSVESSIELGFNAKKRCPFCGSLLWKVVSTVKNIKNTWRKDNAKDNFMLRYSR